MGDVLPELIINDAPNRALLARIAAAAQNTPVLINPNSRSIRYVLHFSKDENIPELHNGWTQSWANKAAADIQSIEAITNSIDPSAYTTLYVLRIGIAPHENFLSDSPQFSESFQNFRGDCIEYVLGLPVAAGNFGKIAIQLNAAGTHYI